MFMYGIQGNLNSLDGSKIYRDGLDLDLWPVLRPFTASQFTMQCRHYILVPQPINESQLQTGDKGGLLR
jgi:hypothetical protein